MKQLFVLGVFIMLTSFLLAQQADNLIVVMRIDVKMDKKLEWEKQMPTFVKSHYPNMKYRVWEVLTGSSTGKYVLIMGPTSYTGLAAPTTSPKGEAAMRADRQALDALCNSVTVNYLRAVESLTSNKSDRKLKYQVATYTEIEMGTWGEVADFQERLMAARKKSGSAADYGILRPSNSGAGNAYVSIRWVENLEELDGPGTFGAVADAYDELYGNNSWYKDWNTYMGNVKSSGTELRMLRTDLSSL